MESLLISLLILAVIVYVVFYVLDRIPMEAGIKQIAKLVVGVLVLIYLIRALL